MSKVKIIPRSKYILVKPEAAESTVSESGLVIPKTVEQEQKAQGEVIAVASEIKDIKKGDRVIYGAYAGEILKVREGSKDVEYKLLHDDDVIAFIQ